MPYIGSGVQRFNTADNLTVSGTSELKNNVTVTGDVTASGTVLPTGDTAAGDAAALGFTSAEGLILTGQGSTSDVVIKNDADTTVCFVPTGTDDLKFNDTARIIMGTGDDLQIIHDGSNSIISDNGTGNLVLRSDAQAVEIDFNTDETAALFKHNGAVELYHDNSKKFETASTGVDITGGFTATDGCTITTADNDPQLTLVSTDADGNPGPVLKLRRNSSSVADEDVIGKILFHGQDGAGNDQEYVNIQTRIKNNAQGNEDGQLDITSMSSGTGRSRMFIRPTETVFNDDSVDLDFRIETNAQTNAFFVNGGDSSLTINGTSESLVNTLSVFHSGNNRAGIFVQRSHASAGATGFGTININNVRGASSDHSLLTGYSGDFGDLEFRLSANGEVNSDGAYNSGGADYAEYFEWTDGNSSAEDRRGYSVVLDGNKIRKATADDSAANIIGVVSAKPVVIGDAHGNKWQGKHLKDDYGNYILEEYSITQWFALDDEDKTKQVSYQTDKIPSDVTVPDDAVVTSGSDMLRPKENPDYNASTEYVPREDRKEWDAIGLMGKLRVRKGQPTGDRWIKMRDVSGSVEEWLVR